MSKSEILSALPKLAPEDREHVLKRLCELQEEEIIRGGALGSAEKRALDEALTEFERDGNPGLPWRKVVQKLRAKRQP
jgi:hypothetical protein